MSIIDQINMKNAFIKNRNDMYSNALKLDHGNITSSSVEDWHAFNNSLKKMSILNWAMGKEISVTHSLNRAVINEIK
ncbi:serine kinase [Vibrio coralliilyticus]|uniref:Serine kinase n=1 Tax=Vibrio coralliilyticus TaxID=190893 RepID=A0AAP6ZSC7_9VIBR|nr:serine kinase [Vibrio coralliilyticus]NOJ24268.1 serine kinase [Vibrio coralliilyticus]